MNIFYKFIEGLNQLGKAEIVYIIAIIACIYVVGFSVLLLERYQNKALHSSNQLRRKYVRVLRFLKNQDIK